MSNVLASLAPLSITTVHVQETDWFVEFNSSGEITVYDETKTIDVDVGIYLFNGALVNAAGYTVNPVGRITYDDIQTAIQQLDDTLSNRTTAPSDPSEGTIYYDTDDNILRLYTDGAWVTLGATSLTNQMSKVSGGTF
jgi:hypothetical protein